MRLCLLVLFAAMSVNAGAQSATEIAQLAKRLEGTLFVVPHRDSADGQLESCGLEFSALMSPDQAMKAAPVKISGSFYLRLLPQGGLAYMLKLGVFDGFVSTVAVAPANAFIRATNSNAPKKGVREKSASDGYALFIGAVDSEVVAAYSEIAEKKQLVVGFNREPGQRDTLFTIDLTVVDTSMGKDGQVLRKRSDEPVNQFLACSGDLAKLATASDR